MGKLKTGLLLILSIPLFISCNQEQKIKEEALSLPDKKASVETLHLYHRLKAGLDKGIMLGHQDALAYGNNWFGEQGRSDVKSICGDYPAVFGWDLGKIEHGGKLNIDSVPFTAIAGYVREAHRLGGISTISWHADNPVTGGGVNDCSQADAVKQLLEDETTQQRFLASLDKAADFFAGLQDDEGHPIPVIFRPFHEHNLPHMFWWNTAQCSNDDFRRLWQLTVDYLRKQKNLHHLLYAYSVYCDESNALTDAYPGNDYTDIIGVSSHLLQTDAADGQAFVRNLNRNLAVMTQFAEKNDKIPAITDTGLEGVKIPNFFSEYLYPVISQYKLSYVLFWRNAWNQEKHYFIPVPGHPAGEDFVRFVSHPDILTCRDLERE